MKKIFNKENLQKFLFAGIVVLVFGVFMLSLFISGTEETPDDNNNNGNNNSDIQDQNPDGSTNTPNETPKEAEKFKAPCMSTCEIVRYFYSAEDDAATQEMSLIQFGSKFFVSRGVTYTNATVSNFDVVAAMSGKVIDVTESSVYGVSITIDHGEGVLTEYIGLSEAKVNVNDEVAIGDVIGVSGIAEYDQEAKDHVHFRVSIDGTYYDPLNVVGKTIEELRK